MAAQEAQRVVVLIEGTAKEVEHLHSYLDALGRHALVAEARLSRTLEAQTTRDADEQRRPVTEEDRLLRRRAD